MTVEEEVEIPAESGQEMPAATQGEPATPEEEIGEQPTAEPEEGTDDEVHDDIEAKKPSRGVQKRLDELTREKYEWKREADYWREAATKAKSAETVPPEFPEIPPIAPSGKPVASNYEDYEDYIEALTDWKVQQSRSKEMEEARRYAEQSETQKSQQIFQETAKAKYPDFEDVISSARDVPCTENMMKAMLAMQQGPEIMYYLAKNPSESARIAQLSSISQITEIGSLGVKISNMKPPEPKRITKTTDPIKTVSGAGITHRDPNTMSMEDYAEWRLSKMKG